MSFNSNMVSELRKKTGLREPEERPELGKLSTPTIILGPARLLGSSPQVCRHSAEGSLARPGLKCRLRHLLGNLGTSSGPSQPQFPQIKWGNTPLWGSNKKSGARNSVKLSEHRHYHNIPAHVS